MDKSCQITVFAVVACPIDRVLYSMSVLRHDANTFMVVLGPTGSDKLV